MKKESLQTTTVKTLLAILLFAGVGTIIFGGGYIIGEYSKNRINNQTIEQVNNIEGLNIIGNYVNGVMSMCAQNCNRYYIGSHEIVNELKDVDGNNKQETVFASGDMVKIIEPPTIAGPDSRERIYPDKIETVKFKVDNYQKIDFPKISISEEELVNYLENKDAEFILKFVNPLNQELKFKFSMNADHDFQYVALKPKETKNIKHIYKEDTALYYKRTENDGFDLMVINDFVDDNNYKEYYWNETNNLSSKGTSIYVYKWIYLKDCKKIDTSDWQTYRNEEFGFEVKYPEEWTVKNLSRTYLQRNSSYYGVDIRFHGQGISIFVSVENISMGWFLAPITRGADNPESECIKNERPFFITDIEGAEKNIVCDSMLIRKINSFSKNNTTYYFVGSVNRTVNYTKENDGSLKRNYEELPDENYKYEIYNQILSTFKFIEK